MTEFVDVSAEATITFQVHVLAVVPLEYLKEVARIEIGTADNPYDAPATFSQSWWAEAAEEYVHRLPPKMLPGFWEIGYDGWPDAAPGEDGGDRVSIQGVDEVEVEFFRCNTYGAEGGNMRPEEITAALEQVTADALAKRGVELADFINYHCNK